MKTVKVFYSLFTCFVIGFLLTAFAPKPLRIIVDEIVFMNESVSSLTIAAPASAQGQGTTVEITPPVAVLDNLPNKYQKMMITNSIPWYDTNKKQEGYFIRIERMDLLGGAKIKLEFKLMLVASLHKAILLLPPAQSQKMHVLKGEPLKMTQTKVRLESKTGLICDLMCLSGGFMISNIHIPNDTVARYQIKVFSKDNI